MNRRGWIYFREDAGRGYCFGKTANPARRDAEYSKENPFIKKLGAFEVGDIDAVEQELILLTAHLRLRSNSKEWLRYSKEVLEIFTAIRERYALLTHAEAATFVPTPTERIQQLYRYCQQCKRRMSYRIARCTFFCPDCDPAAEPGAERKPLGLVSFIALWLRRGAR
jgi:hypothetical protein